MRSASAHSLGCTTHWVRALCGKIRRLEAVACAQWHLLTTDLPLHDRWWSASLASVRRLARSTVQSRQHKSRGEVGVRLPLTNALDEQVALVGVPAIQAGGAQVLMLQLFSPACRLPSVVPHLFEVALVCL
jgi:hypothetical protein